MAIAWVCLCLSSRRNLHHMVSLSSWIKSSFSSCESHALLGRERLSRLWLCGSEAAVVKSLLPNELASLLS